MLKLKETSQEKDPFMIMVKITGCVLSCVFLWELIISIF